MRTPHVISIALILAAACADVGPAGPIATATQEGGTCGAAGQPACPTPVSSAPSTRNLCRFKHFNRMGDCFVGEPWSLTCMYSVPTLPA